MKANLANLLSIGLLSLPVFPSAAQTGNAAKRDDSNAGIPVIQFESVPLNIAIENLGRTAGLNFMLDPRIASAGPDATGKLQSQPNVSVRWENVTAKQALIRLLTEHRLQLLENPATTVSRITYTNQVSVAGNEAWIKSDTNAPIPNAPIPFITMMDVPLGQALADIAGKASLKVNVDPTILSPVVQPGKPFAPPATVSFRWEGITARQAIAALCENYDLVIATEPGTDTVRITRKAGPEAKPAAK